jgi:hypothetical protein
MVDLGVRPGTGRHIETTLIVANPLVVFLQAMDDHDELRVLTSRVGRDDASKDPLNIDKVFLQFDVLELDVSSNLI